MSTLFTRKRDLTPELLTLPAFCVPADEAANLRAKREAQLEWMRSKGVRYLLATPVSRPPSAHFVRAAMEARHVA